MKKDNKSFNAALRKKAEELMEEEVLKESSQLSAAETQVLIHELQVHQIQLELQNEELMAAKEQAEIAIAKYAELYDFAPSGYFTFSKEGEILELNLSGSQMLGKERSRIMNNRFGFFVSDDTKPIFNRFLGRIFKHNVKDSCEVVLLTNGNMPMDVLLCGIAAQNGEQCLVTMIDITELKLTEKALKRKLSEMEIYYELAITRERKMIALKSEINLLLERLGEKSKY